MTEPTVDATVQAAIDALKKIVSDGEAKSADLRTQVQELRQKIIDTEGPEVVKARQKLRQMGIPVFSDVDRPLPVKRPEPAPATYGGAAAAPKAAPAAKQAAKK